MALIKFVGNCPRNVAKDAKYSIKYESGDFVVGILYRAAEGERWYPTTHDHPKLVEMVNQVKSSLTGSPGGSFYINEYCQVIVPCVGERDYYLAGEYSQALQFEFEGHILSGNAVNLSGEPLQPGDKWAGPHPGISYVLKSKASDIYYELEIRPQVTKRVTLTDCHGRAVVKPLLHQTGRIKGFEGGRFYINEFRQMFAPGTTKEGVEYYYIGHLENLDIWFPKPHA
jgi:hypothetical protein